MTSELALTLYETPSLQDGIIRLDAADMRLLGVISGDTVAVEGSREVYLFVQSVSVEDRNQRLARVSSLTAKNLGALTGQKVRILPHRVKLPCAELVTLEVEDDLDYFHVLARKKDIGSVWLKRVLAIDDSLRLPTLDHAPLIVKVVATQPSGAVQITRSTEFAVVPCKSRHDNIRLAGVRDSYRTCQSILLSRFGKGLPSSARSFLLFGPSGCGKSRLVARLAQEFCVDIHPLDCRELLNKSMTLGETDLSALLCELDRRGRTILVLDHLDVLHDEMFLNSALTVAAHNVSAQLRGLLQEIENYPNILLFGIYNGDVLTQSKPFFHFDVRIPVDPPNRWGRHEILLLETEGQTIVGDVDFDVLADLSRGMTANDLTHMVRTAEIFSPEGRLTKDSLIAAFRSTQPSVIEEVHCDLPLTTWEDVVGLDDIKQMMTETLSWSLYHNEKFADSGVRPPCSILLSGGQGTGKTSLVRALANHMPLPFIEVACPVLAVRELSESLGYLRACFSVARRKAPCLIFFDDIDVLFDAVGVEDDLGLRQNPVVLQLIVELDSLSLFQGVMVVAATNRPDKLSSDILRSGRFDFAVTLPMPDSQVRKKILQHHARKLPLVADINFDRIAENTQGMSSAEIANLCNRVGLMALRQALNAPEVSGLPPAVTEDLFDQALRGRKR